MFCCFCGQCFTILIFEINCSQFSLSIVNMRVKQSIAVTEGLKYAGATSIDVIYLQAMDTIFIFICCVLLELLVFSHFGCVHYS